MRKHWTFNYFPNRISHSQMECAWWEMVSRANILFAALIINVHVPIIHLKHSVVELHSLLVILLTELKKRCFWWFITKDKPSTVGKAISVVKTSAFLIVPWGQIKFSDFYSDVKTTCSLYVLFFPSMLTSGPITDLCTLSFLASPPISVINFLAFSRSSANDDASWLSHPGGCLSPLNHRATFSREAAHHGNPPPLDDALWPEM